jgi:hypothetical protein
VNAYSPIPSLRTEAHGREVVRLVGQMAVQLRSPVTGYSAKELRETARPRLLRKLALTILIQVGGHRLRHDISIKTHLEGKVATVRIASGGVLRVGGSSRILDNLFAVQPGTNHAVSLRSETHLEAQVELFPANIPLLLVDLSSVGRRV